MGLIKSSMIVYDLALFSMTVFSQKKVVNPLMKYEHILY